MAYVSPCSIGLLYHQRQMQACSFRYVFWSGVAMLDLARLINLAVMLLKRYWTSTTTTWLVSSFAKVASIAAKVELKSFYFTPAVRNSHHLIKLYEATHFNPIAPCSVLPVCIATKATQKGTKTLRAKIWEPTWESGTRVLSLRRPRTS